MKITFITMGDESFGSSRIRVYQYLPYLKKANIPFQVIPLQGWIASRQKLKSAALNNSLAFIERRLSWFRIFVSLPSIINSDIIFIQKKLLPLSFIHILTFLKKEIIFDFVDAIFHKHQQTRNLLSIWHNITNSISNKRLKFTLEVSRVIIIDNKYNRDFTSQYNNNIMMVVIQIF